MDETTAFEQLGYSISSGDDSGSKKFQIDSSGVLGTTAVALDYETKSRYELLIDVVDDNSNLQTHTSTATVVIMVRYVISAGHTLQ